ncbi:flagellar hook-length control protein FliK [Brevundimonas sp.]|jgi:hypothetical protein|uniref:flagellar hook-length control protein FliK n=1 Tax=Brevundimonas sp. TaxID=1871086 RepID=UPI0037BFA5B4
MPSAFAMFASVLPATAGTPAAAPGVQDGETAGLFSSKLADVLQVTALAEAAKTDAPHRAIGRLSLPAISATELETAEATPPAAEAATPSVETTPFPDDAAAPTLEKEQTETATDSADAPTQQALPPVTPPVVQTTTPAPTVEAAPVDDVESAKRPEQTIEPAAAKAVDQTVGQLSLDTIEPIDAPILTNASPTPVSKPTVQNKTEASDQMSEATPVVSEVLAEPAPAKAETIQVAPPISVPAKDMTPPQVAPSQPGAKVEHAPVLKADQPATTSVNGVVEAVFAQTPKTAEKAAVEPTPPPAETAPADSVAVKSEPTSPKVEIKVTVQPAAVAPPPAQTAANAAVKLAVAEAIQALDTDAEPTEAVTASDAAPQQTADSVAKPAVPAPVAPQHHAQTRLAPTEALPTVAGDQASATDHVAMADATPPSAQTATARTDPASAAAPPLDVAVLPLDPATPVDTPAEARALEATATTTQTATASSLSRATIETTAHLAAQIARKLEGRSTRFDMVLTPEDLGRVDVSLEIGSDGQLAARLAFDNPAAAVELRGRADELRRQLQDAGFQVAGDSLDFTQRDTSSGGGFDRQQQQRQALFAGGSRLAAQADLSATPAPGAWTNHSQTRDRVDVRV